MDIILDLLAMLIVVTVFVISAIRVAASGLSNFLKLVLIISIFLGFIYFYTHRFLFGFTS